MLLLFSPCGMALAQPAPVGRASHDREADLIAELIRRADFEIAARLIRRGLHSTTPQSDAHARWTIRLSELETARGRTSETFSDQAITAAQKPITELLDAYPEHPRRLFLQSQAIEVDIAAAEHHLMAVMINPADRKRSEQTLHRLTDTEARLETLFRHTAEAQVRLDSLPRITPESTAMRSDFARLGQQIQVELVRVTLMITELFPLGSDDRLAAPRAELGGAAGGLTGRPRYGRPRHYVERLRVIALLRSEDLERARRELHRLADEAARTSDDRLRALNIRIDLRRG
ncbi:MAG: hypothetical protein ACF788_12580, partial [Novipirellula sp. JB048]